MNELLGLGEFSLTDKLQPADYIQGRTSTLRKLHKLNPQLAAELISYTWPHPADRQWTDSELNERLGKPVKKGPRKSEDRGTKAAQVREASHYLGKFAESFVDSYMPSMGAALDAFKYERMRQEAISQAEQAARFPALHFTQPVMASYAMGGGAPEVPHRRHRHHTG